MTKPLISIVVPVFNEEGNVTRCHAETCRELEPLRGEYDFEFVFTDNHSGDGTWAELERVAAADPRVRAIRFAKNFGYQRSILRGYQAARGDAAVQLDCDLQDPPALIARFLEHWRQGNKVVYGVRISRREGLGITLLRKIFYRLIRVLSEVDLPVDAGDFRLVDRCVLDVLRGNRDASPYLRGTIAALGFPQQAVPYRRNSREHGESKFSARALFSLARDGILSHSLVPLRVASVVGFLAAFATLGAIFVYGIGHFVFGRDWPAGFATTTILILLSICLNALFLGVIGEYLGLIYRQVKHQYLVVEERTLNCGPDAGRQG